MRFDLGYWWPFARTAWGWIVASATGIAALYYGPQHMLETFDWYMDRFRDYKVRDFLESLVSVSPIASMHGRVQHVEDRSVEEIAKNTKLSLRAVRGSLKRLRRKGDIIPSKNGRWKARVDPLAPN